MIEQKIREIMSPIIEEVYSKGFEDGARHTINMYRYGWENGHADTMAALGEIDIQDITAKEFEEKTNA